MASRLPSPSVSHVSPETVSMCPSPPPKGETGDTRATQTRLPLAQQLAAEAGELMGRRKILLTASAALTTTTSPAAAIRALEKQAGDGERGGIYTRAAHLIRTRTEQETFI